MKKLLLSLSIILLSSAVVMAQDKVHHSVKKGAMEKPTATASTDATAPAVATAAPATPSESMNFKTDVHNFGTVTEGDPAEYEFSFVNNSKEPIVIQRVQPSCGCTTPSYSKEPVAPGQSGTVKASYGTMGRPGEFHKTLTVFYNVGNDTNPQTKVLSINGTVEKAPATSVPENNSMIKTN